MGLGSLLHRELQRFGQSFTGRFRRKRVTVSEETNNAAPPHAEYGSLFMPGLAYDHMCPSERLQANNFSTCASNYV
eukprot:4267969-Amphidinium_carterae.1